MTKLSLIRYNSGSVYVEAHFGAECSLIGHPISWVNGHTVLCSSSERNNSTPPFSQLEVLRDSVRKYHGVLLHLVMLLRTGESIVIPTRGVTMNVR